MILESNHHVEEIVKTCQDFSVSFSFEYRLAMIDETGQRGRKTAIFEAAASGRGALLQIGFFGQDENLAPSAKIAAKLRLGSIPCTASLCRAGSVSGQSFT
jgi:hypothetical protein